jgi:cell division protein FtsN
MEELPPPAPAPVPQYQPQYLPPPAASPSAARLIPSTVVHPDRMYKLQVGSFKMAQNAVSAFTRLKDRGLNPSYERADDFYRVVLSGVRGSEVQSVAEKLGAAGLNEAIIREER